MCVLISFDECSSNSSDDITLDDEAHVDAILEAADNGDSADMLSSGQSRVLRQVNGIGLRGANGRENAGHALLGNWKKYYIDPSDVARHQQREAVTGGHGNGSQFERGSSQRVTLPLATRVRDPTAGGGILVKRGDQPGLPRTPGGRRPSRDAERVSTSGARRDVAEVNAECRTPTVGFALPVSLAARSQLGPGRSSAASSTSSGGKPSGLLTPSTRCAAAHSADAQRGERLSNYRRGTIPRPGSAGHETETANDDLLAGKTQRPASPSYDCSAVTETSDDVLDRSSNSPVDEHTKLGSQYGLSEWISPSSAIVQDGGQGPALPSFYPSASGSAAAGFHDYVNVSYLLATRNAAGSSRPESGVSTDSAGSARSPWVRADVGGGRMAMSETESVENVAVAWPSYGTGPLHRSDSFKSPATGDGGRSASSLPRYGSVAQVCRDDGAGPCLATFRLAAGHAPLTSGHSPRSSAVAAATSLSSVFAHKSRLSASKDDNCTSNLFITA